ncbi:alpha/beta fold hydrolase [Nocardiopsis sp. LOL_012]|uniref:alpha/beta fold hydrolase n=1 Tax=Nocardiopsis sp. LOL_012 TaxID=3345409 RepID=UPI003A84A352
MSTPAPASARLRVLTAAAAVLLFTSACTAEERSAPSPGVDGRTRDLSFSVDGGAVFATFTAPDSTVGTVPGALIISGSGGTDRDGNAEVRPDADTNLNFSRVLAEAGVASLRYDKLGSGETGLGGLDPDAEVDPEVFDRQMTAAYEELLAQPEVDPERTVIVGHSEGSLYALRAHELLEGSPALVLAAPPGTRMLDVIDRQLTEQVRRAEASGRLGGSEAVDTLSYARAARAALRGGRDLPEDAGGLTGIFSENNVGFLRWIDAFDPVDLARDLPADTPVLVLWGEEDAQISRDEVDRLMTGLSDAERVDVPGADHIFREFEDGPGATVLDADRPFAPEVAPALEGFLDDAW